MKKTAHLLHETKRIGLSHRVSHVPVVWSPVKKKEKKKSLSLQKGCIPKDTSEPEKTFRARRVVWGTKERQEKDQERQITPDKRERESFLLKNSAVLVTRMI